VNLRNLIFSFSKVLVLLSALASNSFAGTIELSLSESLLNESIQALSKAGKLPSTFNARDGMYLENGELSCLPPLARLPDPELDTDLTPRVIVHLFCRFKSANSKLELPCAYSDPSQIPRSSLKIGSNARCPHIQIALAPSLELREINSQDYYVPTLKLLRLERFALIPENFSSSILAQKFSKIEHFFLEQLNSSFKNFGNPWFRKLLPAPLKVKVKEGGLHLTADAFRVDTSSRSLNFSVTLNRAADAQFETPASSSSARLCWTHSLISEDLNYYLQSSVLPDLRKNLAKDLKKTARLPGNDPQIEIEGLDLNQRFDAVSGKTLLTIKIRDFSYSARFLDGNVLGVRWPGPRIEVGGPIEITGILGISKSGSEPRLGWIDPQVKSGMRVRLGGVLGKLPSEVLTAVLNAVRGQRLLVKPIQNAIAQAQVPVELEPFASTPEEPASGLRFVVGEPQATRELFCLPIDVKKP
jgi:hypothetical protein